MLDFYVGAQGEKYTPRYSISGYVYCTVLRGPHYSFVVCKLVNGHPDLNKIHKRFDQGSAAVFYMQKLARETDEPLERFTSQKVKDYLKAHGK